MAGLRWTHMISPQEVAEEGKSPYVREIQGGQILCMYICTHTIWPEYIPSTSLYEKKMSNIQC